MKKFNLLAISVLLACGVNAAEVNQDNVVTFTSGTPAKAAEVNTTVSALVSAINDNAATIASLQETIDAQAARISALETTVDGLEANTTPAQSNAVEGASYRVVYMGSGYNYDEGTSWGSLDNYGGSGLVTFVAGGTLDVTEGYEEERELALDASCTDITDFSTCTREQIVYGPDSFTISGTWTQTGNSITVTLDGQTENWYVSPDGNVLIPAKTTEIVSTSDPVTFFATMQVGVRVSD